MSSARSVDRRAPFGKRLELRLRRALIRLLARRGRAHTGHAIVLPDSPRILLLRHDRIGDVVISTPTIALLRERFPSARIDILLGRKNRAAAPLIPSVDEAHVLPGSVGGMIGALRNLRRRRYDLAINLLAKDSASGGMLTALSGARFTIGFQGELASIYTAAVDKPGRPEHIVAETTRLLAPLGIEPISGAPRRGIERLTIALPEDARREAERLAPPAATPDAAGIILNISTPGASRRWDREKFAELARLLAGRGLSPALASTPGDAALAAEIAAEAGAPAIPPTGSLATFAAILERATLVVTPDTSIVHIAAALGRPVVVLNTEKDAAATWTPWGVPYRLVCGAGAVSDISVADVDSAILSLLDEIAISAQPSTRI